MRRLLLPALLACAVLAACAATPSADERGRGDALTSNATGAALDAAIAGPWRDPRNVARDVHRHPKETLRFFGVNADDTVIEITPGGGWYAEILAPYLRERGRYVAAVWDDAIPGQPQYRYDLNARLRTKFAADPAVYGTPEVRVFDPQAPVFGPPASADVVLTFRNVHNWVADGNAEAYFRAFFDVLKEGGTLGVVDHRARPDTDLATMKKSGYLTEALVLGLAQQAGFVLEARSEINANPKDTADHPNGVWTLPPTRRHDPADAARYEAIGESDRMTLRFRKPRRD